MFEALRGEFGVLILIVFGVAWVLKNKTPIRNELIPAITLPLAFLSCTIWGFWTTDYTGAQRVAYAVLWCGLLHGGLVWSFATSLYDVYKGISRAIKRIFAAVKARLAAAKAKRRSQEAKG